MRKTIITLLFGFVIGGAGALIVGGGTGCDTAGLLTDDQKIVGSKAQCDEFMAKLRKSK